MSRIRQIRVARLHLSDAVPLCPQGTSAAFCAMVRSGWIRIGMGRCEQALTHPILLFLPTGDAKSAWRSVVDAKKRGDPTILIAVDASTLERPPTGYEKVTQVLFAGKDASALWMAGMSHLYPAYNAHWEKSWAKVRDPVTLLEWMRPVASPDFVRDAIRLYQTMYALFAHKSLDRAAGCETIRQAMDCERRKEVEGWRATVAWLTTNTPPPALPRAQREILALCEKDKDDEDEQDDRARNRKKRKREKADKKDDSAPEKVSEEVMMAFDVPRHIGSYLGTRLRDWRPDHAKDEEDEGKQWATIAVALQWIVLAMDTSNARWELLKGWARWNAPLYVERHVLAASSASPRFSLGETSLLLQEVKKHLAEDPKLGPVLCFLPTMIRLVALQGVGIKLVDNVLPHTLLLIENAIFTGDRPSAQHRLADAEGMEPFVVAWMKKWKRAKLKCSLASMLRFCVALMPIFVPPGIAEDRPDPNNEDLLDANQARMMVLRFVQNHESMVSSGGDRGSLFECLQDAKYDNPSQPWWEWVDACPYVLPWLASAVPVALGTRSYPKLAGRWVRMEHAQELIGTRYNSSTQRAAWVTRYTLGLIRQLEDGKMAIDDAPGTYPDHLIATTRFPWPESDSEEQRPNDEDPFDWLPESMRQSSAVQNLLRWLRPTRIADYPQNVITTRSAMSINWVIADELHSLVEEAPDPVDNVPFLINRACGRMNPPFKPDPSQMRAVSTALSSGVCVVRGGSGSGKTTTMRILDACCTRIIFAAPTGAAVRRLMQLMPHLQTEVRAEAFRNAGGRAPLHLAATLDALLFPMSSAALLEPRLRPDVLVVDETSMVASLLLAKLMLAIRTMGAPVRVVFVGDPEQLMPVGSGAPFLQMIESKQIPVCELTGSYRSGNMSVRQTGDNIRAHCTQRDGLATFEKIIVVNPKDGVANRTSGPFSKTASFRRDLALDYGRSVKALPASPLDRVIVCPRKGGNLGVIQCNYIAKRVWRAVAPPALRDQMGTERGKPGEKPYALDVKDEIPERLVPDCSDPSKWSREHMVDVVVHSWKDEIYHDEDVTPEQAWKALIDPDGQEESGNEAKRIGVFDYAAGDPVMCISRLKKLGVLNGDLFVLLGFIDPEGECIFALRDDVLRRVIFATRQQMAKHFTPAYALTVHKVQGAEFPHVFVTLQYTTREGRDPDASKNPKYDYYKLFTKRLLYTAVTRTKKVLSIYGWRDTLMLCMDDYHAENRNDFLKWIMERLSVEETE